MAWQRHCKIICLAFECVPNDLWPSASASSWVPWVPKTKNASFKFIKRASLHKFLTECAQMLFGKLWLCVCGFSHFLAELEMDSGFLFYGLSARWQSSCKRTYQSQSQSQYESESESTSTSIRTSNQYRFALCRSNVVEIKLHFNACRVCACDQYFMFELCDFY